MGWWFCNACGSALLLPAVSAPPTCPHGQMAGPDPETPPWYPNLQPIYDDHDPVPLNASIPAGTLGEVYHLGAAMVLNPRFQGMVVGEGPALERALEFVLAARAGGEDIKQRLRAISVDHVIAMEENYPENEDPDRTFSYEWRPTNATAEIQRRFGEDADGCQKALAAAWEAPLSQDDKEFFSTRFISNIFMESGYPPFLEPQDEGTHPPPPQRILGVSLMGTLDRPSPQARVLLWNRKGSGHDSYRDMTGAAYLQIAEALLEAKFIPILLGPPLLPPLRDGAEGEFYKAFKESVSAGQFDARDSKRAAVISRQCVHFEKHWSYGAFNEPQSYLLQLYALNRIVYSCGVVAQVGSKSGAMDGPALLGCPTLYLESCNEGMNQNKDKRMARWINAVPNYKRLQTAYFMNYVEEERAPTLEESEVQRIVEFARQFRNRFFPKGLVESQ